MRQLAGGVHDGMCRAALPGPLLIEQLSGRTGDASVLPAGVPTLRSSDGKTARAGKSAGSSTPRGRLLAAWSPRGSYQTYLLETQPNTPSVLATLTHPQARAITLSGVP
ncbi:MAG: hypothetical protein NVSMB65_11560 [Chloroflexota bacterium]